MPQLALILTAALLVFTPMSAQSPSAIGAFVQAGSEMEPTLVSSNWYSYYGLDQLMRGRIAVINRSGVHLARTVVGFPGERKLTTDPHFIIRSGAMHTFVSVWEDSIAYISKNTPFNPSKPLEKMADLATYGYTVVLRMSLSQHNSAEALADSMFYVIANNRPTLSPGAERSNAQGADSREWGTIHARDLRGIIID